MQIPTFSQPRFLHIWLRRSGPAVLLISLSGPWISVFSPTNPPHTNLHIGSQAVPSGMKTRHGSPSNWASERSGCLFIWQRTWLAKTYCLNPSFPCSYYIIILISCPNWNQQKHNPTPFLSFSPPLKGKVRRVCVAVQLELKACGLVKCRGLFPFLFAFCRLHFFSTRRMKQTHAASGREERRSAEHTWLHPCSCLQPDTRCCL